MTLGIIELNDSGLRLSQASQQLVDSPGFALITDQELVLGEKALRQARVHPLQTNNQFWQRLNLDPLANANAHCRHHADLAFNHLKELQQLAENVNEVIFAIPGHFSRDQLALLLGITQACDFNAVGLVDSATASLAPLVSPGHYLHLDIHLHQSVISHVEVGSEIVRTQIETIPGAGMIALYDAWAQLATEQFIQQTRFDPLHNASTEQQLYDQLPDFLETCHKLGEAQLSLQGHKIAITQQSLQQKVSPIYERIQQKLSAAFNKYDSLDNNSLVNSKSIDQVYLSDRWANLPGFSNTLANATLLDSNAISKGCQLHESNIRGTGDALNYVTNLPLATTPVKTMESDKASDRATTAKTQSQLQANHLLCGHQAYAASQTLYVVCDDDRKNNLRVVQSPTAPPLCTVTAKQGHLEISALNGSGIKLNNKPAHNGDRIYSGDQISLQDSNSTITAINVIGSHGS